MTARQQPADRREALFALVLLARHLQANRGRCVRGDELEQRAVLAGEALRVAFVVERDRAHRRAVFAFERHDERGLRVEADELVERGVGARVVRRVGGDHDLALRHRPADEPLPFAQREAAQLSVLVVDEVEERRPLAFALAGLAQRDGRRARLARAHRFAEHRHEELFERVRARHRALEREEELQIAHATEELLLRLDELQVLLHGLEEEARVVDARSPLASRSPRGCPRRRR